MEGGGQSRRRPIKTPANQDAGQSRRRPIKTPANQDAGQSRRRPIKTPANQDAGQSRRRPIKTPANQDAGQSRRPQGASLHVEMPLAGVLIGAYIIHITLSRRGGGVPRQLCAVARAVCALVPPASGRLHDRRCSDPVRPPLHALQPSGLAGSDERGAKQ